MSDSPTDAQNPEPDQGDEQAPTPPLAESGSSPERVEHVDVTEHDEVDQAALDIAESTSSDEPPA